MHQAIQPKSLLHRSKQSNKTTAPAIGIASSGGALPVVDLAPLLTGDRGGIARATEAVREACRTHGFFRAVNHGVLAELLAAFFALPGEEKTKVRSGGR
nr:unnamed protein product [Digitaria exilis]